MTIAINYKNSPNKKGSSNLVLFVDEKFNILSLKKHIANSEYKYILDIIKSKNLKKKILTFDFSSKKKIILISLNKQLKSSQAENLGAEFFEFSKNSCCTTLVNGWCFHSIMKQYFYLCHFGIHKSSLAYILRWDLAVLLG